jgi:hypothetical protein
VDDEFDPIPDNSAGPRNEVASLWTAFAVAIIAAVLMAAIRYTRGELCRYEVGYDAH